MLRNPFLPFAGIVCGLIFTVAWELFRAIELLLLGSAEKQQQKSAANIYRHDYRR